MNTVFTLSNKCEQISSKTGRARCVTTPRVRRQRHIRAVPSHPSLCLGTTLENFVGQHEEDGSRMLVVSRSNFEGCIHEDSIGTDGLKKGGAEVPIAAHQMCATSVHRCADRCTILTKHEPYPFLQKGPTLCGCCTSLSCDPSKAAPSTRKAAAALR